ncbi:MAG TPA: nitroreductase family protein [Acidimicrobiia bacterium]|nr:nitroreductase family protein [Acidimicrobiia bacterium]
MELSRAMRTTPSTREFTDDPLPDDVLHQILDDARFAPNGGNRQGWRVVVVRDPATKARIAELYDLGMREYMAFNRAGLVPFSAADADKDAPPPVDLEAAREIPLPMDASYFATVPVLLVILLDLAHVAAVDCGLDRLSLSAGASVYPFAHNILLAARAAGYGGHFTTVLARQEPALRELLGYELPYALATMIPLGKPVKEITKLRRLPVEEFTSRERFDGAPFTSRS